jgi:hypothetical protein
MNWAVVEMERKNQQGISTVLILGIIAVLVTLVIPLVSQTVVDVRISKQQEEQARAFSIAETGLEKALIGEADPGVPYEVGDITYRVARAGKGGGEVFIYPKNVERDSPITVWLMEHQGVDFDSQASLDTGGDRYQAPTIDFYWGEPGTPSSEEQTPAVEVTLFYQDSLGNFEIEKYPFDPHVIRRGSNRFDLAESGGPYFLEEREFQFRKTGVSLSCTMGNVCYALRLRLLYNDTPQPIAIEGVGDNIPRQGECFQSVATVETSGITSRLERCSFYKDFPSIFDFVLYSSSNLEKGV